MSSTIYVVDDTADYRLLVKQAFVRFLPQHMVQFFASGDALYDAITTGSLHRQPDLILLDMHMPGRDGLATLHIIRQAGQWPYVPVVVMSNAVQPSESDACYEAGASSVMQKPDSFDQLAATLQVVCQYWLNVNRHP